MKNRKKFLGLSGVLNISIVTVSVLLVCVGFFGYWKFGDAVEPSLTKNLRVKESL